MNTKVIIGVQLSEKKDKSILTISDFRDPDDTRRLSKKMVKFNCNEDKDDD